MKGKKYSRSHMRSYRDKDILQENPFYSWKGQNSNEDNPYLKESKFIGSCNRLLSNRLAFPNNSAHENRFIITNLIPHNCSKYK